MLNQYVQRGNTLLKDYPTVSSVVGGLVTLDYLSFQKIPDCDKHEVIAAFFKDADTDFRYQILNAPDLLESLYDYIADGSDADEKFISILQHETFIAGTHIIDSIFEFLVNDYQVEKHISLVENARAERDSLRYQYISE